VSPLGALLAVLAALSATVMAADWPQWRGPARNAVSSETGLRAGLLKDIRSEAVFVLDDHQNWK
jgi:hypothetical protein